MTSYILPFSTLWRLVRRVKQPGLHKEQLSPHSRMPDGASRQSLPPDVKVETILRCDSRVVRIEDGRVRSDVIEGLGSEKLQAHVSNRLGRKRLQTSHIGICAE